MSASRLTIMYRADISKDRVRELIGADDASIISWDDPFAERNALAQRCRELEADNARLERFNTNNGQLLVDSLSACGAERDSLRSENVTLAEWYLEAGVREDTLRAEVERLTKIVGSQVVRRFVGNDQQREIDDLVALGIEQDKQEIADLKARLLEAERGNEALVRLRANERDLRNLLAECAEYLNINKYTSIGHGSILHRKMMEAAACASTDGDTPAA